MKIKKVEAIPFRIPLKESFAIASGRMTHSNHVMVRIEGDSGLVGWGETTTFHSVYGYDQKSLYNVLQDYLIPAVTGWEASDIEGLHQQMDSVIPCNLMAKCGIDLAVHDLLAKKGQVPLHQLLGGKKRDRIQTIAAIGIVETDKAAEKALELKNRGYGVIKVKVGLQPEKDLERLEIVRATVGDDIRLRVDANQGYDLETILDLRRRLDDLELEWLEQPLPAWDLEGLKKLTRTLKTPIAVDENVYTIHDVRLLHSIGAANVINIKVVKCGGIHRSRQIARFCDQSGIPWFLGGCLETAPGNVAQCHFYAAVADDSLAVETGGDFFVDDIVTAPVEMDGDSYVLPEGEGIGVQIDEDRLSKYKVQF